MVRRQGRPRLFDPSISDLDRTEIHPTDEPGVIFTATPRAGCISTEILLSLKELQRLTRWANWD